MFAPRFRNHPPYAQRINFISVANDRDSSKLFLCSLRCGSDGVELEGHDYSPRRKAEKERQKAVRRLR
jgi:ribosomal protein S30